MLCRPARNRITAKPMYFHVMMTISEPDGDLRVGQPVDRPVRQPDLGEQVVDRAVGLEHEAPAGADDDLGDHVGHEDQHPDDRAPAHLLVEQEREQHRGRALEDQGQHHDERRCAGQRLVERGVLQDHQVVLQPDEVGGRAEALPLEEAVVRRPGRTGKITNARNTGPPGRRGARSRGACASRPRRRRRPAGRGRRQVGAVPGRRGTPGRGGHGELCPRPRSRSWSSTTPSPRRR